MISEQVIRPNVSLFGRFQVKIGQGNENPIKWRTSKTEELMAYLIHHRGEMVDRDKILDSLWGEVDVDRAWYQLNTTVYYLRKHLDAIGLEGSIQHVKGYYLIQMSRINGDYKIFHQMVSDGLPNYIENAKENEEKLTNIYQTGYFIENDFPWAEETKNRLESSYIQILLKIYEHYLKEKDFSSGKNVLKKILVCNPMLEEVHGKLIHLYLLMVNRVSAIKQYDSLKQILETELGMEPQESLKALLENVL